MRRLFFSRTFALLLSMALAPPSPCYALRQINAGAEENPPLHRKLQETLFEDSPAPGAEELSPGEEISWVGFSGASIGRVVPILTRQGDLAGRVVFPDPSRVELLSAWNPQIFEEDFPQWAPTESFIPQELFQRQFLHTGHPLAEWQRQWGDPDPQRRPADIPSRLKDAPLVLLASSHQWNFWPVWGFLVVEDARGKIRLIRQKYARERFPLNGAFWAFVLAPAPRLCALRFDHNDLVAELADVRIQEGLPVSDQEVPPDQIRHAIPGVPLVLNGTNVAYQIRTRPADGGIAPNEVTWPISRVAAFTAVGRTKGTPERPEGRLFIAAVMEPLSVSEFADLLLARFQAEEALLLEGSTGAKQAIFGLISHPVLIGQADRGSAQFGRAEERPSNAMLLGYELPAPAAGAEEEGEWKELEYHLSRLENRDAPPEARIQEAEAIYGAGLHGGKIRKERYPALVDRLLPLFASEPDPRIQPLLLEIVSYAGLGRPEIREIFARRLQGDPGDPVMASGIVGLRHHLLDADDPPAVRSELLALLPLLFPILSRGDSPELGEFLQLLYTMLLPLEREKRWVRLRKSDPAVRAVLEKDPWLEALRRVYDETGLGDHVLWRLGQPVSPKDAARLGAGDMWEYMRLLEEKEQERPLLAELSPSEIQSMIALIARKGRLPARLLGELFFEEGKQWIFLNAREASLLAGLKEGRRIVRDLRDLVDQAGERPVVLALPLPRGLQGELERALRDPNGEISQRLREGIRYLDIGRSIREAGYAEESIRERLEDAAREFEESRTALRSLGGNVHLECFGPDLEVSGENAFDQMLSRLREIGRSRPGARVLVYAPLDGPEVSKRHLTSETGRIGRSLAAAFGEEVGPERVASVIEETEFTWSVELEQSRLHNLADLGRSVPTSFAAHLRDLPLQDIRFSTVWRETYDPEVWDALIFRREDGREDTDFFTPPEEPRPEALEPDAGPRKAAAVSAGAEEPVRVMRPEEFSGRFPGEAQAARETGASGFVVLPEGSAVRFYHPPTLKSGLEEFIAEESKRMPPNLVRIVLKEIPRRADDVRPPAVAILDALLPEPPYSLIVPKIRHYNGRPFEHSLPKLVAIAVLNRLDAATVQVLAAWEFESQGRRYSVLAVQA